MKSGEATHIEQALVDHIPVIWSQPRYKQADDIVIWLPGFSGTKESVIPQLNDLADRGFLAVSFDPYQHGDRRVEKQEELVQRIIGNIRRYFWPILALTAEEYPRIIDWAMQKTTGKGKVMVGGVSMGGDISVAAAGVDQRISAVAACIATPDWMRPGSHEPPGNPDRYAMACYERRNPLTNINLYQHHPAITFQCGEMDTQVPADGAERFVEALKKNDPDSFGRYFVKKHKGVAHRFTPEMWQECLQWFQSNT